MQRATEMQKLNLADAAAEGRLLAVVQNMLTWRSMFSDRPLEQHWIDLRQAYEAKEAAHQAVLDFLCEATKEVTP